MLNTYLACLNIIVSRLNVVKLLNQVLLLALSKCLNFHQAHGALGIIGGFDDDPNLLEMSDYLLEFPFSRLLFPEALAAIAHLKSLGRPVVLSDGDIVFQPRKIKRAGIWDAVDGAVLIYLHKEKVLDHVERRYPAAHYVVVDDKPNLLAGMKLVLRDRLTTVFVRQGHYALAPGSNAVQPSPDRVIERIGDIATLNLSDFGVRA